MSSFVRRTAARLSSSSSGTAAAEGRKGSDLDPIMEDYGSGGGGGGSGGRETDGSRSGGVSTSATFTTDDGEPTTTTRPGLTTTSSCAAVEQFQMHDLKSVQHRSVRSRRYGCSRWASMYMILAGGYSTVSVNFVLL